MDLLFFLIPFSVSMADFSKPSSFCLEICFKNPSILRLVTAFKGMRPSSALHNIYITVGSRGKQHRGLGTKALMQGSVQFIHLFLIILKTQLKLTAHNRLYYRTVE